MRIFVCRYHNISAWMKVSINKIEKNDLILICRNTEPVELSIQAGKNLQLLKSNIRFLDYKEEAELPELLLKEIRLNADESTAIYFIQSEELHTVLKDQISVCKGVGVADSLRVGRTALYKNGQKVGISENKKDTSYMNSVADLMAFTSSSKEKKEQNASVPEQKKEPVSSEISGKNRQETNTSSTSKRSSKKDIPEQIEEVDMRSIEREIFGVETVEKKIEEHYNNLDNAKANLVSCLYERFVQHMKFYVPIMRNMSLSREQYTEIILLLTKSENVKDFTESLDVLKLPVRVGMKEYLVLRDEAIFYSNICSYLYEKDFWD